jgi:hypothetical protein
MNAACGVNAEVYRKPAAASNRSSPIAAVHGLLPIAALAASASAAKLGRFRFRGVSKKRKRRDLGKAGEAV